MVVVVVVLVVVVVVSHIVESAEGVDNEFDEQSQALVLFTLPRLNRTELAL